MGIACGPGVWRRLDSRARIEVWPKGAADRLTVGRAKRRKAKRRDGETNEGERKEDEYVSEEPGARRGDSGRSPVGVGPCPIDGGGRDVLLLLQDDRSLLSPVVRGPAPESGERP